VIAFVQYRLIKIHAVEICLMMPEELGKTERKLAGG
jgi:hypothetical protein